MLVQHHRTIAAARAESSAAENQNQGGRSHFRGRPEPIRDPRLRRLRSALVKLAPRPELLVELMGFAHFADMAMTREGLLIGRRYGRDGLALLGCITEAMRESTRRLWLELTREQRALVIERLIQLEIPPERIGIDADMARAVQPQLSLQEATP